jgi:ribosome biogenesis GTPase
VTTQGLIIRSQSGFYTVCTDDSGELVCQLRGRLKKGRRQGDIVAVGDRVTITDLDGKTGMIEAVEPRSRMFMRIAPDPHGEYRQIILANPDQAVLVFACAQPAPHLGMLDRYLVIAEKQSIPAVIVANKVDLVDREAAEHIFGHYPGLGYPVFYASAYRGDGIKLLRNELAGKLSLFSGPSGVGKSTLLNAIQPGLGLAAREISQTSGKGRHTTVVRQLFPLEMGGYVADTPGLKALALWDIEPEELDGYFPELRARVDECQFNDCTHVHEPGCAVLAALAAGEIHAERYRSYRRMRFGDVEEED